MAISKNDSKTINLLRFLLTFIVLTLHSMGEVPSAFDWHHLSSLDMYYLFKIAISGCFAQIAVPVFFFISGYLFFSNIRKLNLSIYMTKMRTRLGSLVVPYVLWNLLSIPLMLLVMYGEYLNGSRSWDELISFLHSDRWGHIFSDFYSNESTYSNLLNWKFLSTNPVLTTFWFVRDLIVMSILSPVFYWFARKTKWWGFTLLMVIFVLRIWPYIPISHQSLFFVFGSFWSIMGCELVIKSIWIRRIVYVAFCVLGILMVILLGNSTFWGFQLMPVFTLLGCYSTLSLVSTCIARHPHFLPSKLLANSSFFVYALHIEFALPLAFFITKFYFKQATNPILLTIQYLLTPCIMYLICFGVYLLLRRLMPRVLVLLGGRE